MQKEGKARRLTYFCGQIGTVSLQKEGKAGRLTYFCAQIGTVSLQKEGKARRLTYFCGRSLSGRKTDAKQIPAPRAVPALKRRGQSCNRCGGGPFGHWTLDISRLLQGQ